MIGSFRDGRPRDWLNSCHVTSCGKFLIFCSVSPQQHHHHAISLICICMLYASQLARPRRFHTSLPLQCKNFFCGLKFTMTSAFEKLNDPEEPHDSFSRHISFSRVVKQGGGPPAPKRKYEPAAPLGRAGKPEKLTSVQTLWLGSYTFHLPKLVVKPVLLFYNSLSSTIYFHMIRPYT